MSTQSTTHALSSIGTFDESRGNLRAYLAGAGATTALIAGLVVLFLAAAAYVAFNGSPFGGDESSGNVTAGSQVAAGAPEAAALALAPAADAVASSPTTLVGGPTAAVDGGTAFALATGAGGQGAPGTTPPGTAPGPGTGPTAPGGGGAFTDTVGTVDDTVAGLGLPLNLGGTTGQITQDLDRSVTDTLNNVRTGDGRGLGDDVNDTVGGIRDGVNRGLGGLGR